MTPESRIKIYWDDAVISVTLCSQVEFLFDNESRDLITWEIVSRYICSIFQRLVIIRLNGYVLSNGLKLWTGGRNLSVVAW